MKKELLAGIAAVALIGGVASFSARSTQGRRDSAYGRVVNAGALKAFFDEIDPIPAAMAQSSPGLVNGQVPTPAQWNAIFASKQDYGSSIFGTIVTIPPLATSMTSNIATISLPLSNLGPGLTINGTLLQGGYIGAGAVTVGGSVVSLSAIAPIEVLGNAGTTGAAPVGISLAGGPSIRIGGTGAAISIGASIAAGTGVSATIGADNNYTVTNTGIIHAIGPNLTAALGNVALGTSVSTGTIIATGRMVDAALGNVIVFAGAGGAFTPVSIGANLMLAGSVLSAVAGTVAGNNGVTVQGGTIVGLLPAGIGTLGGVFSSALGASNVVTAVSSLGSITGRQLSAADLSGPVVTSIVTAGPNLVAGTITGSGTIATNPVFTLTGATISTITDPGITSALGYFNATHQLLAAVSGAGFSCAGGTCTNTGLISAGNGPGIHMTSPAGIVTGTLLAASAATLGGLFSATLGAGTFAAGVNAAGSVIAGTFAPGGLISITGNVISAAVVGGALGAGLFGTAVSTLGSLSGRALQGSDVSAFAFTKLFTNNGTVVGTLTNGGTIVTGGGASIPGNSLAAHNFANAINAGGTLLGTILQNGDLPATISQTAVTVSGSIVNTGVEGTLLAANAGGTIVSAGLDNNLAFSGGTLGLGASIHAGTVNATAMLIDGGIGATLLGANGGGTLLAQPIGAGLAYAGGTLLSTITQGLTSIAALGGFLSTSVAGNIGTITGSLTAKSGVAFSTVAGVGTFTNTGVVNIGASGGLIGFSAGTGSVTGSVITGTSGGALGLLNGNNTTSGNNTHTGQESFTGTIQVGSAAVSYGTIIDCYGGASGSCGTQIGLGSPLSSIATASTITLDLSKGPNFLDTVTGNTAISITRPVVGECGEIKLVQGATLGTLLTLGAGITGPSKAASLLLTGTTAARDLLTYCVDDQLAMAVQISVPNY